MGGSLQALPLHITMALAMAGSMAGYLAKLCGINSTGGLVVVLWSIVANQLTLYSCALYLFPYGVGENDPGKEFWFKIALLIVQIFGFLIYPISGLLADIYWTRYYTMYSGLVLSFFGTLFLTVATYTQNFVIGENSHILYSWPFLIFFNVLPLGIIQLGVALFSSNAVQFATDQMTTASSTELSSLVHWYFAAIFFGELEASFVLFISHYFIPSFGDTIKITTLFMCTLQVICLSFAVGLLKLVKAKLVNEPAGRNPLRVPARVLKYTLTHKYPTFELRSSFTYGAEIPNRFDFAKVRYGGPFTTEEVEDAKSFFRICFIFLSTIGFTIFTDETVNTTIHMRQLNTALNLTSTSSFDFFTIESFGVSALTIMISILTYQFFIRRYLAKYWPTMLKRIFVGLLLSLVAVIMLQLIELALYIQFKEITDCNRCSLTRDDDLTKCFIDSDDSSKLWEVRERQRNTTLVFNDIFLPYQTLVLPRITNGFAFFLVFLTAIEFILAQAPRIMQGFLIGLWQSLTAYKIFLGILATIYPIDCQPYILSLRALGMIIFLPIYITVAVKYKRRTREEYTNINAQNVIEEYYTRAIERSRQYDDDSKSCESFHISSL